MKPLFHRALEPQISASAIHREHMSWVVFGIALAVAIGGIVGFWYTTVPYLVR